MASSRLLGVALTLIFAGTAAAQTTQSVHAPDGLTVSPDEYRAKLEALQRKAATQPAARPAVEDPAVVAARRDAYLNRKRLEMQTAADEVALMQEFAAKAQQELPQIEHQLGEARVAGQAAEARLGQVLNSFNLATQMAWSAGETSFSGTADTTFSGTGTVRDNYGNSGYGTFSGDAHTRFSGTSFDRSKQLAAIMAVEDQYGPELKQARQELSRQYQTYTALIQRRAQLVAGTQRAAQLRANAINRHDNASRATARLAAQPGTSADAAWAELQAKYPGVDVRALWELCVKDATAQFGANDPNLQSLATGMLHARASAATTKPSVRPDPLGIEK